MIMARMTRGSMRPLVLPATTWIADCTEAMSASLTLIFRAGRLRAQRVEKDCQEEGSGKLDAGPE